MGGLLLEVSDFDQTDEFDRVPDSLVLLIFNQISDIKTLIRCRAVSRRFNSLVRQADSLLLKVDRVVSAADRDDKVDDSFFVAFLRSIFRSFHDFISPKPLLEPIRCQNSPSQILCGFEKIRELAIELPTGDLRLEKGAVIKWKAEFGRTLKSCVILGFRHIGSGGGEAEPLGGGLKMRVVWTISALIAASARHYMMLEVVREHKNLQKLVVRDRENEGTVVMNEEGLREYREGGGEEEAQAEGRWSSSRTVVPAARMRMRHEPRIELESGVWMEGATLVVVRPVDGGVGEGEEAEAEGEGEQHGGDDVVLAYGAFGGVYGKAVEKLLKSRSYLLEMNSF